VLHTSLAEVTNGSDRKLLTASVIKQRSHSRPRHCLT